MAPWNVCMYVYMHACTCVSWEGLSQNSVRTSLSKKSESSFQQELVLQFSVYLLQCTETFQTKVMLYFPLPNTCIRTAVCHPNPQDKGHSLMPPSQLWQYIQLSFDSSKILTKIFLTKESIKLMVKTILSWFTDFHSFLTDELVPLISYWEICLKYL